MREKPEMKNQKSKRLTEEQMREGYKVLRDMSRTIVGASKYLQKKLLRKMSIEEFRSHIENLYEKNPTGCGSSFGEILCYEIHENGLTFLWLADKWEISVSFLGELIADHCKKLE